MTEKDELINKIVEQINALFAQDSISEEEKLNYIREYIQLLACAPKNEIKSV